MAELPHVSLVPDPQVVPPVGPTDAVELLSRAGSGDEAAFAALYDATCQPAYGLALRVVRDPELAAEVTLAAYREVWRSAARHDARRISPTAWILSVVHAHAVAAVRSDVDSSTAPTTRDGGDGGGPTRNRLGQLLVVAGSLIVKSPAVTTAV